MGFFFKAASSHCSRVFQGLIGHSVRPRVGPRGALVLAFPTGVSDFTRQQVAFLGSSVNFRRKYLKNCQAYSTMKKKQQTLKEDFGSVIVCSLQSKFDTGRILENG